MRVLNWIEHLAAKVAVDRAAPDRIPMSPSEASSNDFFTTKFFFKDGARFYARRRLEKGFEGILWPEENNKYGANFCLLHHVAFQPDTEVELKHFFKGAVLAYDSYCRFLLSRLFHRASLGHAADGLFQSAFNSKPLVRTSRHRLLVDLLDHSIESPNLPITANSVGSKINSRRWFHHPNYVDELRWIRFALDSLVASGDLKKTGTNYEVAPDAMKTIADFELEERRHNDAVKQAASLKWLTFALVLLTLLEVVIFAFRNLD